MQRRTFLQLSALGALGAIAPRRALARAARPRGLKLLVLGGTSFLGPAIVEAARLRGHTLTLFNRGKTNPGLFPDIEQIHGDRKADLAGLKGRTWDAVIDTSGYLPPNVEATATALKDAVRQYVFISTISVYGETLRTGPDETTPVATLPAGADATKVSEQTYGPLKALCEQAAERVMPGRVANVRPGLIVGPRDPTDRFTYWPVRVARGGEVLAPGRPTDPVQFIDVRDLGAWLVHIVERNIVGVFNATGPKDTLTTSAMLDACRTAAGSDARFTWADTKFLESQKIEPWSDMPVWVPPDIEGGGLTSTSRTRAVENGLIFRPVLDTARDTLAWWKTLPEERRAKLRAGISPEREQAALAALKSAAPTVAPAPAAPAAH